MAEAATALASPPHWQAPACRHAKNVNSDAWRRQQLLRSTSRPGHPFNSFSTGNADTLLHEPKVPYPARQCRQDPSSPGALLLTMAPGCCTRCTMFSSQACDGACCTQKGHMLVRIHVQADWLLRKEFHCMP